ncbi:MAG: bifunctional folylpolyglutamate synthase/dihydrofolate synthase [Methyloligella sp.]|nr:MAG: bifunctional folylpolyglutamate synthase/dihydrofolate synthase [Methyloligella sp.]
MKRSETLLQEMHKLHPKLIDLSLDRIHGLLEKLGKPHESLPSVIHIAGTNGKGSVLAFLTAILEAHGDKVQRFSSPHLVSFHERINLPLEKDNQFKTSPIPEDQLVDVLQRTKDVNGEDPITFFEITTAAAFLAFSETKADWCLLETGLGGRLDSTNVMASPAATILSPISIDHTKFLGESIREIAREKIGILKPNSPVFVGIQEPEPLELIEQRAAEISAPSYIRGQDYDVYAQRGRLVYSSPDALFDLPLPRNMLGRHQIENAGLALCVAQHLLKERLNPDALATAMKTAHWPARMQRLQAEDYSPHLRQEDELWLDGGHNPAAALVLADILGDLEERVSRPLHIIIGMMDGKDVRGFLKEFLGLASQVIAVPIPGEENAMNPDRLADLACEMGFESESAATLDDALQISAEGRHEGVRVLICGSLYLAGYVLSLQETN